MDAHEKALRQAAQMLRLANDDRTPDGERQAARGRIHALCRRHGLLGDEVEAELQRQVDEDDPLARRRRAYAAEQARRRQQQPQGIVIVVTGMGNSAFGNTGFKTTFRAATEW